MNLKCLLRLAFCPLLLLLLACEPDMVFTSFHHIGSEGWLREDTLSFNTDTLRHDGVYQFYLSLRTTRRFPYQKVAIAVERKVYRNKVDIFRKCERVVCTVASEQGDYSGNGVGLLQYDCKLRSLQLERGDSIVFRVAHFMATDTLTDIRDVGILVERN